MKTRLYTTLAGALISLAAAAANDKDSTNNVVVSGSPNSPVFTGSIQSDILFPQTDKEIGSERGSDWARTNTYLDLNMIGKHIDAGLRVEYNKHPLPGFENDFKGWGVPYWYIKFHSSDRIELTVGDYYEQFGSGFILRTYEERSLGIDNSLLGARLVLKPYKGITFKAITGRQRRYWSHNKAKIKGLDLELNLDQWFSKMADHNTYLTLGASWVNKKEAKEDIMADPTHKVNVPKYVNAFDVRANLHAGGFGILGEYAWKTDDPSFDNNYIFRKGKVAMLSATYSQSGMSLLLQAKRSEYMSFRSKRTMMGTSSYINHLPAFTMEHTYALAALYPYATHPDGEWAYQAELGYKFKRNTALGGKYGTDLKVNFSHVHALDRPEGNAAAGTAGYGSSFWKWGDQTYYQDLNVQIGKKFTRSFTLNLMYMNQFYNKTIVEGEGGMVHSDIYVAEGKYRFNSKYTLRGEMQYLNTADDQGDWLYGLLELSVMPHWMFTLSDMYNSGETHIHYYQGYVTYNCGAHRLQVGYGRTRAGYNCSGGVCRWIPACKGVTISYNYNF